MKYSNHKFVYLKKQSFWMFWMFVSGKVFVKPNCTVYALVGKFCFFRGLNGWRWQVGKQKNWASNNQKMRQRKMFRDQVVLSIWCKSLEFYFTEGARNPKWRLKYEKSRFMVCVESRFKMAAEKPWRKSRRNSKLSLKNLQKTRIEMWRLYK